MTGVCKDKDDNGESKECQPHENLCFYTKTEVKGGGSTYYRNCFVGYQGTCQSYDYNNAKGVQCFCSGDNCNSEENCTC